MKDIVKLIPVLGRVQRMYWRFLARKRNPEPFPGSAEYWERRYSAGGNSGAGSYALFAEFKAEVLNGFVAKHKVKTVIEFGCGDGNQLILANYPAYLGLDISSTAITKCQAMFKTATNKSFSLMSDYNGQKADLALSLDVIYHLIEDNVFEHYMRTLFDAAIRYVIIYASDSDDNRGYEGTHVRHRKFTNWINKNLPNWELMERLPNRYPYQGDYLKGSFADFFIYRKS